MQFIAKVTTSLYNTIYVQLSRNYNQFQQWQTEIQVNNATKRTQQDLYKTRVLGYTCITVTNTSGLTIQWFTDLSQLNAEQYWADVTDESMPPVYR